MNKIITIGYLGTMKAYLNIEVAYAIERYCKSENITEEDFNDDDNISIETIEFKEEFGCYSLWDDES